MDIIEFFKEAISNNASDIFIIAGKPLSYTCNSEFISIGDKLLPPDTQDIIHKIYDQASRNINILKENFDDDFSFSIPNIGRFRVNTFIQRGSMAAILRIVLFNLPDASNLGIPKQVTEFHKLTKGLVLVTGPAGSGKSTTLACIIDQINKSRSAHIITLEDPIEYLHRHDKSIVTQREIFLDTKSYSKGLRAALREAPNVILLGEMRDYETIAIAMSAAETGQLIFSTLHTLGTANTIDRIIDVFPPDQQHQVRIQLSMVLKAVVCQQLIPSTNGKPVPAFEIMMCNNAIRNMIRESKVHQIDSIIYSSKDQGMINMDTSIMNLYEKKLITKENALVYSLNHDAMKKSLSKK
ncbi:type IV pilus twitching motility protein PilT [Anaerovorax odorimutans]|uniref:type IV pilus twitching motility protein PilT n=1 Tax=Anaerovorax odorimutans TaxID=109327 RepID=UPI0004053248|nr:PilT/PilU family type 4a pilus ATPase [Anaerovorax odorimutans]